MACGVRAAKRRHRLAVSTRHRRQIPRHQNARRTGRTDAAHHAARYALQDGIADRMSHESLIDFEVVNVEQQQVQRLLTSCPLRRKLLQPGATIGEAGQRVDVGQPLQFRLLGALSCAFSVASSCSRSRALSRSASVRTRRNRDSGARASRSAASLLICICSE